MNFAFELFNNLPFLTKVFVILLSVIGGDAYLI
jgi:hypothetical protein